MTDPAAPTVVFVEHVLWTPRDDWDEALAHLAGRFERVSPLDATAVREAGTLAEQIDALERWAGGASVDLDRELGRWFDEHLSMHVRPAPVVTRAVRAIASASPVHAASALPPRAAESITRHAGCWRSVSELHGNVRSADQVDALVDRLGASTVVVDPDATAISPNVTTTQLTPA